jgi:hypothetical protein
VSAVCCSAWAFLFTLLFLLTEQSRFHLSVPLILLCGLLGNSISAVAIRLAKRHPRFAAICDLKWRWRKLSVGVEETLAQTVRLIPLIGFELLWVSVAIPGVGRYVGEPWKAWVVAANAAACVGALAVQQGRWRERRGGKTAG